MTAGLSTLSFLFFFPQWGSTPSLLLPLGHRQTVGRRSPVWTHPIVVPLPGGGGGDWQEGFCVQYVLSIAHGFELGLFSSFDVIAPLERKSAIPALS